jgi:hypothetical protein
MRVAGGTRAVPATPNRRHSRIEPLVLCQDFSSRFAVNPIGRRLGTGGFILLRRRQFFSCRQGAAKLHESAHDVDTHLNSAWRTQDVGGLGGAVLGEHVWQVFNPVLMTPLAFTFPASQRRECRARPAKI